MSILYVMAVAAEYGPHLQARITPLMTGIGPVEAAVAVTRALAEASHAGALPGLVSIRRGIPAIAELLIGRATARAQLTTRLALVAFAGFWLVAPLL